MRTKASTGIFAAALLFLGAALVFLTFGCGAPDRKESLAAESAPAEGTASREKGAAELWVENCVRCHNSRSPASYSDEQWEVAMLHMRVRANLTAEEHGRILEFLKAGN